MIMLNPTSTHELETSSFSWKSVDPTQETAWDSLLGPKLIETNPLSGGVSFDQSDLVEFSTSKKERKKLGSNDEVVVSTSKETERI